MVKVTLLPTAGLALLTDLVTAMSEPGATMLSGASCVELGYGSLRHKPRS